MILSIYSLKTYHNFFYYFASICNASSSSWNLTSTLKRRKSRRQFYITMNNDIVHFNLLKIRVHSFEWKIMNELEFFFLCGYYNEHVIDFDRDDEKFN
jgi:hypothetical protein